jgi:hypothetical protein
MHFCIDGAFASTPSMLAREQDIAPRFSYRLVGLSGHTVAEA